MSLTANSVVSWRSVPGAYAPVTLAEYAECELVTRADPGILAGLERRGITRPEQVLVEPWGIGAFTEAEEAGRRLAWTLLFYRERPDDNPYAKPIHGLHAIVDLDDMTVVRVEDLGAVSLPPGSGAYAADRVGPLRDDLKPLEIVRPARSELRHRRLGGPLAALAGSPGLHRARRPCPAHRRVRGQGQGTAGDLACLSGGTVHPLRRPAAVSGVAQRFRHRRVRDRDDGQLTRARLRLPRGDPLLRRPPG